jgi:alpha-ketoglutaric semialdehyde dehydrogenase
MTMILGNYMDGRWIAARSGASFEKRNPADDRDRIGEFPSSSPVEVQEAVNAARRALPAWRALSYEARAQFLYKASAELTARQTDVASALTREEGKSLAEASGETGRGAMILRYFAAEGLHGVGEVLPSINSNTLLYTERVPLGVTGLITPWNFPVAIPLWKAAPALVYGNTVVFKPSEHSPMTAQMITEVFQHVGLPAGVFNLVQGGRETGEALNASSGLNGISFTGSVATGKSIARMCVERGLRYQLEMGGKNPVVVLEDANLDRAVELTVQGAMKSAGEKCTATSRVIVIESIADEFVRRLATRVKQLKTGPGTDTQYYLGPLISKAALGKALQYVDGAVKDGALLLTGGAITERHDLAHGNYMFPALLDNVRPEMAIAQEEVFAPVLAILRVPDFDAAIRVANDVAFGLSASVFTRDLDKAMRFAREVEAGLVRINGETAGVEPQAPFGGMKSSSSFSREQGQAAKDFYTQVKTISIDRAD